MGTTIKIVFWIFNIVMFAINFLFIGFIPSGLCFGWLPGQFAFFIGSMLLCGVVWGIYYYKFFDTQKMVDEKYKDK